MKNYKFQRVLHRPVFFWAVFAAILLLAAILRMALIDIRPFHSDEGVNYHFIKRVVEFGYYPYSHENYHGPSYFYLTWFFTTLFGYGELAFRGSAILAGVLTVVMLAGLRKLDGALAAIIAAFGVTLSATLVFVNRYAIHESLFVLAQLGLALALYSWFRNRQVINLYVAGQWLALMMATKETYVIAIFCLFFAFHALGDWKSVYRDLFIKQRDHFVGAIFLMLFTVLFIFTAAFAWWEGAIEFPKGVPQWFMRNESDTGHFKPWGYYLEYYVGSVIFAGLRSFLELFNFSAKTWRPVMAHGVEPQLILIGVILCLSALLVWLKKSFYFLKNKAWNQVHLVPILSAAPVEATTGTPIEAKFGRFCTVWWLLALIIYSLVDYKTPWLIINITLPLVLSVSLYVSQLLEFNNWRRYLGVLLSLLFIASSAFHALKFNFTIPFGKDNPGSYVHTGAGTIELVNDVKKYLEYRPKAKVRIGVKKHTWPLPYYFRDDKANFGYAKIEGDNFDFSAYDIVIAPKTLRKDLPGYIRKYYRLSDIEEAEVYYQVNQKP